MFHLVARATARTWLFLDWREADALWRAVLRAAPAPAALVLMPNHVHLVHPNDVRIPLARALSGYVRWRNAARGQHGPGIERLPPAEPVAADKVARVVRYVHLNPCRAALCADPLAWPFSTHRDATGFAQPGVVPVRFDRARFHRYVSADPTVDVEGTALPTVTVDVPQVGEVWRAVSAVTRTPLPLLADRPFARRLFVRAARTLCDASAPSIASVAGLHPRTVHRVRAGLDAAVRAVAAAVGDPRLPPLVDGPIGR